MKNQYMLVGKADGAEWQEIFSNADIRLIHELCRQIAENFGMNVNGREFTEYGIAERKYGNIKPFATIKAGSGSFVYETV